MIRLILVLSAVALYLILSLPVLFYLRSLEKKDAAAAALKSLNMVRWILGIVRNLAGITCEVRGLENIPKDRAVLYVGNHRSYFDIVMGYTTVPSPTGFIAKKEMIGIPLLNLWMEQMNCLFLDRANIKEGLKTILNCIATVKGGCSICIFPEGTRTPGDEMLEFKEGSFKIAEKGNVPIIPMTIVNSAAIFEDHFPKIKKATVVIEYGKPIYMKDLDKETRKSMGTYVQNIISETYFKNKELI